MSPKNVYVNVGDLVFCREDGQSVGAVRQVHKHALMIDIEGLGDVSVPSDQIAAVHEGKLVLAFDKLAPEIQEVVEPANDDERRYR
jgi:hypothetical protein